MRDSEPTPPSSGKLPSVVKIIVAAIAGTGLFVLVQQREKKQAEERQAIKELREAQAEMKREFDQNGGITADSAEKTIQRMRGQIDKMSAQGGNEGKAMKAVSEVMAELQAKTAPYFVHIKRIETDNPADMRTVKDKADLAERRKFAQELLRMNQDLIGFVNAVESVLREKIRHAGITDGSEEKFITGFMKGYGRTLPPQRKVRKADETMGKAIIAMTDLLEGEWGKWSAKDGELVFNDNNCATRFNGLVEEIQKAADEQSAAQRELIEMQQRGER